MRLKRDGSRLVFEDRPFVAPAVLGAAAMLMAYRLWQWAETGGWTYGTIGLGLGTLALAAGAFLLAGGSRFVFDRTTGWLTWSRRTGPVRRGGTLPIADIETVGVTGEGCAFLHLRDGARLVLTIGRAGGEAEWADITAGIRLYLGLNRSGGTLTDTVAGMLRAGRKPEAIRLVRLETGLDRAAAKATVENISHRARPRRELAAASDRSI